MRVVRRMVLAGIVLALLGTGAALAVLDAEGVTPRALGPYLLFRTSGHNALIEGTGQAANDILTWLDRGPQPERALPPLVLGAQPEALPAPVAGTERLVTNAAEMAAAVRDAAPGDVITLVPGEYLLTARQYVKRPGTAAAPIVVRAAQPGSARIAFAVREGFTVSAPYWRFENLAIDGVCGGDGCEHAFHVVGDADHFVARNNTIRNFHAHFKINGESGRFPDHGLIESNTLYNDSPRMTWLPVTPIDLVAASDWVIRANRVSDFVKAYGDRISYGIFAKGGAQRTLIERNVVVCEERLRRAPGQRIGMSFGGGGSGRQYCRDRRCITEHDEGVMRANLIMHCADVGIYLNSAGGTQLVDNTVLDTAGVQVRYPTSGAALEGNLVDGPVRSDEGGLVRLAGENRSTAVGWLYAGRHPQRALFVDPDAFDLRWKGEPPRRDGQVTSPDLCGATRGDRPAMGAFEDFGSCLRR